MHVGTLKILQASDIITKKFRHNHLLQSHYNYYSIKEKIILNYKN